MKKYAKLEIRRCKYCNEIIKNRRKAFCCIQHYKDWQRQQSILNREHTHCLICGKELGWHQNSYCSKSHARMGKSPFLGKKHKKETIEKISLSKFGHEVSEESKEKISKSLTGLKQSEETKKKRSEKLKGHPNYLKSQSESAKQKIAIASRIAIKKRIEKYGVIPLPNFNIKACEYFKKFDEENNTKGKYALYGGGEYYVKELGYWLDYINFEKKLIIEWDEKHHYTSDGFLKEKDIIRQKKIPSIFPDFIFDRIKDI